jgi:hypothetical protein
VRAEARGIEVEQLVNELLKKDFGLIKAAKSLRRHIGFAPLLRALWLAAGCPPGVGTAPKMAP